MMGTGESPLPILNMKKFGGLPDLVMDCIKASLTYAACKLNYLILGRRSRTLDLQWSMSCWV